MTNNKKNPSSNQSLDKTCIPPPYVSA